MKKTTKRSVFHFVKITLLIGIIFAGGSTLLSFTVRKMADDFLKQLGMTKSSADEKIANSILGGYLDAYGTKNIKSVLPGNRTALAKDLLAYTREYVHTPEFSKQYEMMRDRHKPVINVLKTPAELKEENIRQVKKLIADSEAGLKKADGNMKAVYEKLILEGKKQLAAAEDPENSMHAIYEKNYPEMIRSQEELHQQQLKDWEERYPANPLHFVKFRLNEFLQATENIDFNAQLVEKNGKKLFINPDYERKSHHWKMAFRAGKEVVEPSRDFVQQWIREIK